MERTTVVTSPGLSIDQIKRLVVISILSDDDLFENLVLKGGNAVDLIYQIVTRASVDIDFSMVDDFPGGADELERRVRQALEKTFRAQGYSVFDLRMSMKPEHLSDDMASFWGGYGFEFKLISLERFKTLKADLDKLRKHALTLGQGKKFLVDVSRYEYTQHKKKHGVRRLPHPCLFAGDDRMRKASSNLPTDAGVRPHH